MTLDPPDSRIRVSVPAKQTSSDGDEAVARTLGRISVGVLLVGGAVGILVIEGGVTVGVLGVVGVGGTVGILVIESGVTVGVLRVGVGGTVGIPVIECGVTVWVLGLDTFGGIIVGVRVGTPAADIVTCCPEICRVQLPIVYVWEFSISFAHQKSVCFPTLTVLPLIIRRETILKKAGQDSISGTQNMIK